MGYIVFVLLLNGQSYQWAEFPTKVEAECHKTRLFDYNRKHYKELRKRGFDIPTNWEEYNKKVIIK